ncbi:hypothetical protein BD626DRAFT_488115 [Schizophyllum amplum]|uniref:Uncharacterized protein n=1 Tax=Schizophyllum amplum TaxID=97359 RepID=A0A550CKC7_9AGAR|nr:hypothetical protein BD626DRAFT_488115 [Auriculariopsis ampla]
MQGVVQHPSTSIPMTVVMTMTPPPRHPLVHPEAVMHRRSPLHRHPATRRHRAVQRRLRATPRRRAHSRLHRKPVREVANAQAGAQPRARPGITRAQTAGAATGHVQPRSAGSFNGRTTCLHRAFPPNALLRLSLMLRSANANAASRPRN